ncbi:MAG TPA: hypothetical protein VFB02_16585 [Bradyrhizobium sp.]|nr:hypothetical protein [Bradyrhizobium sp.]
MAAVALLPAGKREAALRSIANRLAQLPKIEKHDVQSATEFVLGNYGLAGGRHFPQRARQPCDVGTAEGRDAIR